MQMFGREKDQCLCNSLLNFGVDCEKEIVGQKWRDTQREREKKKKSRQPETESYRHSRIHKPWDVCVCTQACTHQYAVTKASQIGNSFSQFRFNDRRGNVNVSDVAGASLYSLRASIFVLHDGTRREGYRRLDEMPSNRIKSDERQNHCGVPQPPTKKKRGKKKKQPTLVPGPLAPQRRGLARHTIPAASHLHLNGLLCTEGSEMSFGGGLASPWLLPTPLLSLQQWREAQLCGGSSSVNLKTLCSCLSFPHVLYEKYMIQHSAADYPLVCW